MYHNNKKELKTYMQKFDWGYIKWLNKPEYNNINKMMVGHVTFLPNKKDPSHTHLTSEQILYVISGRGKHIIDDIEYPLVSGSVHHIKHNSVHYLENTSDVPLEMIIVYNPIRIELDEEYDKTELYSDIKYDEIYSKIDYNAIQKIQDDLSKALNIGIVIEDIRGNKITEPSNIPRFCNLYFDNNRKKCINDPKIINKLNDIVIEKCCYNLVKIKTPIYIDNSHFGNILCGPIILNDENNEIKNKLKQFKNSDELIKAYEDIMIITNARMYAIIDSIKSINKFIVQTGINQVLHDEFKDKTNQIIKQTHAKLELEKALKKTQMELIESQISPHFLFNTLSVIGELAYMDRSKEAAKVTFALSNLLRISLSKSRELVFLSQEIDYIKDYMLIQNKRFKKTIKLCLDIDDRLRNSTIPFMTIQTLVENSIKHGFKYTDKEWKLCVTCKLINNKIRIEVLDNGLGLNNETIENQAKTNTGFGLKNLKTRLKYYYGNDHTIIINNLKEHGMKVIITIPYDNEVKNV
ncbi:PocR ligand-binding domain-containing protein [Clostridiaceae bacterium M8S5]|nr:PocR ligand-binding domain-containing protein [Clostridiaceae bacterium M8S5]